MSWAKADFDSPSGLIKSHWERDGEKLQLLITVPPNCSATVWFPEGSEANITEDSGLAKHVGQNGDYQLYEVESGNYHFSN